MEECKQGESLHALCASVKSHNVDTAHKAGAERKDLRSQKIERGCCRDCELGERAILAPLLRLQRATTVAAHCDDAQIHPSSLCHNSELDKIRLARYHATIPLPFGYDHMVLALRWRLISTTAPRPPLLRASERYRACILATSLSKIAPMFTRCASKSATVATVLPRDHTSLGSMASCTQSVTLHARIHSRSA